jgi:hypothetical protein
MNTIRPLALVLIGSLALLLVPGGGPRLAAADKDSDVIALAMEVNALQQLHDLKVTPAQMEELAKLVKTTAGKMPDRKAPKVSAKCLKLHDELRQALLDDDDEKIDELGEELDQLKKDEKVELDDGFDLTDEARKKAAEALRRFSPRQVAAYIANVADDLPDPLEELTRGLNEARKLTGKEWNARRDEIADDVAGLLAGIDKAAEEKMRRNIVALLAKAAKLTDAEFKDQSKALEKEATDLVGNVGPIDVIRNFALRSVGELLSNPRSLAALEGRLKKGA